MKYLISLILLIHWTNSKAQTTARFISSETKEPISDIYAKTIKNEYSLELMNTTNQDGYYSLTTQNIGIHNIKLEIDSTASYQLSLNYPRYQPIWKEVNLTSPDTIAIELKKDEYYISDSNTVYSEGCECSLHVYYEPRKPRGLNDLPKTIAYKAVEHIKNRVGIKLSKNFKLVDGQIIDLEIYKKVYPKSNLKTAYSLCFSYRDLNSGIVSYTSNIELDEKGKILKSLEFPTIKNPNRNKLISFNEIKKIALKNEHYTPNKSDVDIQYNSRKNILIWKFSNTTYNRNKTYIKKTYIYNAHNGRFLKKKTKKGSWMS